MPDSNGLTFHWPAQPRKIYHRMPSSTNDYLSFTTSQDITTPTPSSTSTTEPSFLDTITDAILEQINNATEIVTEMSSNISSNPASVELGITESIGSNQTITESIVNDDKLKPDLLTTISWNMSSVASTLGLTEAADSNQTNSEVITTTIPSLHPKTEPNLLTTIRDGIFEQIHNITELVTEMSSSISSNTVPPELRITEIIESNQTVTDAIVNNHTLRPNFLTTTSSNISSVATTLGFTAAFDADQTTLNSDIFTSLSANTSLMTAAVTESIGDSITNTIAESTETVANDILTTTTLTTGIQDSLTTEAASTFSSVMENITETLVNNITNLTSTTYIPNIFFEGESDDYSDIIVYVVLGIVLSLLIIVIIMSYVFCRKCKSRHNKTGDYYVTQYSTSSNC